MSRTFIQLIGAVQLRLVDGDGAGAGDVRWTLQEKKDAINLALRRFGREVRNRQMVTFEQDAGAVYQPAGGVTVYRLLANPQSPTVGSVLRPIAMGDLLEYDADWQTTAGTPYLYVWPYTENADEKTMLVYPAPSSALTDMKAPCWVLPANLSANGDVPTIPTAFHDSLVDGACALLLTNNGQAQDLDLAGGYEASFAASIAAAKAEASASSSSVPVYVPYRTL